MLYLKMSEKTPPGHPPCYSGSELEGSCSSCEELSSSFDTFDLEPHGRVVRKRSVLVSGKIREKKEEFGDEVILEGHKSRNDSESSCSSSGSSSKSSNNNGKGGGGNSISKFLTAGCNLICCVQMTPQRLLKSAFSIRAFRGSEIRKVSTKVEMLLKSNKSSSALPKIKRSKSNENLPSSQSQMDIQMMSHTLAIKEVISLIHLKNTFIQNYYEEIDTNLLYLLCM